jgi:hypothetical protein
LFCRDPRLFLVSTSSSTSITTVFTAAVCYATNGKRCFLVLVGLFFLAFKRTCIQDFVTGYQCRDTVT